MFDSVEIKMKELQLKLKECENEKIQIKRELTKVNLENSVLSQKFQSSLNLDHLEHLLILLY